MHLAWGDRAIPANSLIEVRGLVFNYRSRRALDDLSFDIEAGTVTALVGPNGAGKTTLLRCLAGLEEPLAGRVIIDGVDVLEHPREAHGKLGFLQDLFGVYDNLSVLQNVAHAAAVMAIPSAETDEAVRMAIHAVDLDKYVRFKAGHLSRGLRQRLAIARTIIHRPKVLLLDEPASGLDPEARRELSTLVRSLQASGTTLIVSSHILTELEDYSTHMLAMRDGHVRGPVLIGGTSQANTRMSLTCISDVEAARKFLVGYTGVSDIAISDRTLTFAFTGDETLQYALLRQALDSGQQVSRFGVVHENLEQLYFAEPVR